MVPAAITDDRVSIRCIGDDTAFLIGIYIDVLGTCNGKGFAILATMSFITYGGILLPNSLTSSCEWSSSMSPAGPGTTMKRPEWLGNFVDPNARNAWLERVRARAQ